MGVSRSGPAEVANSSGAAANPKPAASDRINARRFIAVDCSRIASQGKAGIPSKKCESWREGTGDSQLNASDPFSRASGRSEEHTSELQSLRHLVCRLL